MVGHWQDASDADQVDTHVRWSANEAFLIRSFVVTREGEEPFEGTQVIGWDPRAGNIRSWTFSSDGSFGEGVWSAVGDEWHVLTAQTLADGRAATATQIIRRIDDDTATVQTIGKEIDGQPEPASDPVTIARVVEEPATDEAAPAGAEAEPAAVGAVCAGRGGRAMKLRVIITALLACALTLDVEWVHARGGFGGGGGRGGGGMARGGGGGMARGGGGGMPRGGGGGYGGGGVDAAAACARRRRLSMRAVPAAMAAHALAVMAARVPAVMAAHDLASRLAQGGGAGGIVHPPGD